MPVRPPPKRFDAKRSYTARANDAHGFENRIDRFWPIAVVVIGCAAYANSFSGQFIFDDTQAIVDSPYVRRLWPLTEAMKAPEQSSVAGRPVVALTLAINYAISGLNVWSYHAFNLAIHLFAALILFGIIRRTLFLRGRNAGSERAASIAGICAIIWVVHPVQTESVTYIIQRAEALVGLFYLLTLYCFVRAIGERQADSRPVENRAWLIASVVFCAIGMATKEVMATAPLVILMYDGVFVAPDWREIIQRRKAYYACIFLTWAILAAIVIGGPRSESAGFGLKHATPLEYARTQFGVILYYLKQVFWPDPLCLDWYWQKAKYWWQIYPQALGVVSLLCLTVWALRKRPELGFLGVWFFLILAPTSTIVPIADLMFEHRMYLPIAAVIVLTVLAVDRLLRKIPVSRNKTVGAVLAVCVVVCLTVRTLARNADYHDGLAMWQKTVQQAPWNPRAYTNVAIAYLKHGQKQEAVAAVDEAVRIDPGYADAYRHLAKGLGDMDDWNGAAAAYVRALAIEPTDFKTLNNYGTTLQKIGDMRGAADQFEKAVAADKSQPLSWYNLGLCMLQVGQPQRSLEALDQFLKFDQNHLDVIGRRDDAIINYGSALLALDRKQEAVEHFKRLVAGRPDWPAAHYNLGLALSAAGNTGEAMSEYARAIALDSAHADARCNLGLLFKRSGKLQEAESTFREAIKMNPNHLPSLYNLGVLLAEQNRNQEAIAVFEQTLRIAPQHVPTQQALQIVRQRSH